MKTTIVFLISLLLLSSWAFSEDVDQDAALAEWEGGGITVAEYIHWWERMTPDKRPTLSTVEEKADFLDDMINAQIMLQEAMARGEHKHPNVTDWVHSRRVNALRERLFEEAVKGRLEVDEAEVRKIYEKRLTQVNASHIILPTYEKARAIADSLKSGVPFEDLAKRHSTCSSGARGGALGPVRWGDFTDRWSTQAFALEPGEFSQPFEVEDGYAVVKVHDKTLLEPEDPEAEKVGIRASLLRQDNFAEREAFLDSLKIAYGVDIDIQAVVDLCARYAQALIDLGITSEVIDEDIEPPLTEREKDLPVARFEDGIFTYHDIVHMILSQPYIVRPKLDDPDEIFNFINRQLNDSLMVREAEKRGIDRIPEVANELEKVTQNRILTRFYRVAVEDVEIPEDSLRAFYDTHRDGYVSVSGHVASKIVFSTREEADSVLQLVESGASFEDIARERSIDLFTAPAGGDMGFYPPGKDPEFDEFFAQLEVGEKAVFRSVEGHVVLWLRERHESRPLSFEEARSAVVRDVSRRFKPRYLHTWLSAKREELKVSVNETLLVDVMMPSQ